MAKLLAWQTVVYLKPDVNTSYDFPKLEKKGSSGIYKPERYSFNWNNPHGVSNAVKELDSLDNSTCK